MTATLDVTTGALGERKMDLWQDRAGARLVYSSWARHASEPYHAELLAALMARFAEVVFVVGFDGFFYDPADADDRTCTLMLWAITRRPGDHARSYVEHAHDNVPAFVDAWVSGWQAGRSCRAS